MAGVCTAPAQEQARRDPVPRDKINPLVEHDLCATRHRWTPPSTEFSSGLGLYCKSVTKPGFVGRLILTTVSKKPNTEPTSELIYWAVSKPCHTGADVDLMRGPWWFGTSCLGILWREINKCRAPAGCPQVTAAGPPGEGILPDLPKGSWSHSV